jgi:hypothetical protein
MNPIKFPEVNKTYAENQPEYQPIPVYQDPGPDGYVISCWQLSWKERLKILFTGKLWMGLMCFHKPLTPSNLSVYKSDFLNAN